MWVWLKLKLTSKGDFSVNAVMAFFVNFFMHSPKWYLNGQIYWPLKWDQNLKFIPLRETMSIPVTFIWESPLPSPRPSIHKSDALTMTCSKNVSNVLDRFNPKHSDNCPWGTMFLYPLRNCHLWLPKSKTTLTANLIQERDLKRS